MPASFPQLQARALASHAAPAAISPSTNATHTANSTSKRSERPAELQSLSSVPCLVTCDRLALKAICVPALEPRFRSDVRPGDLVVAGRNFAPHAHPHACVAIKESGIAAAIVESCDSAFIRKALNVGLPMVV